MSFAGYVSYQGNCMSDWARQEAYFTSSNISDMGECRPIVKDVCSCPEDLDLQGYGTPADPSFEDNRAPWYDPNYPESREFLGLWIDDIGGLEDPSFTRDKTDNVHVGSTLSRLRLSGRELDFHGYLYATSCKGMEWGIRWLNQVVGGSICDDCNLGDMEVRTCCGDPETCVLEPSFLTSYPCTFNTSQSQVCALAQGTAFTAATNIASMSITDLGAGRFQFNINDPQQHGVLSGPGQGANNRLGVLLRMFDDPNAAYTDWNFRSFINQPPFIQHWTWFLNNQCLETLVVTNSGIGLNAEFIYNTSLSVCPTLQQQNVYMRTVQFPLWDSVYGYGTPLTPVQSEDVVYASIPIPVAWVLWDLTVTLATSGQPCDGLFSGAQSGPTSFSVTIDDYDAIGIVSQGANVVDGFVPNCLAGGPGTVMEFSFITTTGDPYTILIPFDILTVAPAFNPSGTGVSAVLQIDTSIDIGCSQGFLHNLQADLEEWLAVYNTFPETITPNQAGQCYTYGPGIEEGDGVYGLKSVGLLDPPRYSKPVEGCGCTIREVDWTMLAETPYLFRPRDLECRFTFDPSADYYYIGASNNCPPLGVCDIDPNCNAVDIGTLLEDIAKQTLVDTLCSEPALLVQQKCCEIQAEGSWEASTVSFEINSGTGGPLRDLRILIYTNDQEKPLPLYPLDANWICEPTCTRIEIPYLPEDSRLTIDSTTRTVTAQCGDSDPTNGSRYINNSDGTVFSWPEFACNDIIVCVQVGQIVNGDAYIDVLTDERIL